MDGKFAASMMMLAMIPEEVLVDKAVEALERYKLIGGEKPKAQLMAVVSKWAQEGQSIEEVLKMAMKAEQVHKVGMQMTNFDDSEN